MCSKSLQLCPTLCDPMDYSPPGSSVHGDSQARILEWVAMPSSRGSPWPKDQIHISMSPAWAGGFFTTSCHLRSRRSYSCCLVTKSCPTLWGRMDSSLPGSSVCRPGFKSQLHHFLSPLSSSSSVHSLSLLTLCDLMDCSTPGLPVHHHFPELAQAHVHWVGDANQPSHPLSSPSPPAFNLSQHQGFFQCIRWPE